MRYIDTFNHLFPKPLWERMSNSGGAIAGVTARMRNVPCIHDLDARFRVMDMFADKNYTQVISLGMPPLEAMGGPEIATEFAKLGNDGMAELVAKYPDRFVGYLASLPMNAPDAAVREAERVLKAGASGLQVHSNINGEALDEPKFFPIFEVAAKYGRPVCLHPARFANSPDYKNEAKSKYEIWWTFGWPYETSVAMARIVFSGMLDKLPELKLLCHHLGAMVPYFEGRVGPGCDQLGARTTDEDLSLVLKGLKKRPFEYFKDFYADSATFGSRAAMVCGLEFYGADKVLFASDCPFDPEQGPGYIRETIAILESLPMPQEDREKICFKNAQMLMGVK